MKRCPKCNSTYTDESLSYCLADGTQLVDSGTEPMTVVIPDGQPSQQTVMRPQPPAEKHGIMKWIIAGFLLAAFAGLVVAAIAAAFYFGSRISVQGGEQTPTPAVSPTQKQTPTPQPSPTIAANNSNANLVVANNGNTSAPANTDPKREDGFVYARIDAPGDGFLALRSEPSEADGERIAKIPHGSLVTIDNCEREQKTVSGKKGRWCAVEYGDLQGWVFDAWLKRDQ